jgi:hypothetical protein
MLHAMKGFVAALEDEVQLADERAARPRVRSARLAPRD